MHKINIWDETQQKYIGLPALRGESAYELAVKNGYVGTLDQWLESISDKAAETVKAEVPLVKTAEQPLFANSTAEMTDPSKIYVKPDGYMYRYTEKENYNLLKLSEVSYSSRLQNDVEGVVSSTAENLVTGWIPVEYGKYYSFTALYNGVRLNYIKESMNVGISGNILVPVRMNIRLSDGSVVVYNKDSSEMENDMGNTLEYMRAAFTIPIENAVAVRIQLYTSLVDISSDTLFRAYEPMLVAGDTAEQAFINSSTLTYVDGDAEVASEWVNTGLQYNLPSDYEDRVAALENNMSDMQMDIDSLKTNMENPESTSPYYRDLNFGIVPTNYYKGVNSNYDSAGFNKQTKYTTFIEKFDTMIGENPYVTKSNLGTSSDGQSLYLYNVKPAQASNRKKKIPKIIIIGCQHGFERANVFGMYYFVENLLNNWQDSESLTYLKNNVELLIVPIVNTYGFDSGTYTNANGVNLNRNYDANWVLLDDTTSVQYGGTEPFDQPETEIIKNLIEANPSALMFIDFHTNGDAVNSLNVLHWYGTYSDTPDNYFNRLYDVIEYNMRNVDLHFNIDYEFNAPNQLYSSMAETPGTGLSRTWVAKQNILSVVLEGFNGFVVGGVDKYFEGVVYKANEEILVNWLITAMNYLKI